MSHTLGTKLGPYEILAPIGAGGMEEVYKAEDTRLDRTVAIKVLPSHLAENPDLKQRFEREARAVSSLNHPHICTLYEFDTQDGTDFLVMEYIEGETLAENLTEGALPVDKAIEYAIQIADGLDKAHRAGIVHRDLKPGNVMLTKLGIKILDFGLAKVQHETAVESEDSEEPTRQKPLTDAGSILGTVQYMAPEQLEGKEADARTDIFAFGAVVYEMVTGRRAFEGKSQASLIAAIMEHEPSPLTEVQPLSPPALERAVKKCLAKDPQDRWYSAHDLRDELKWIADGGSEAGASEAVGRRPSRGRLAWVLAFGLLLGALVGMAVWNALRTPPPRPVSRSVVQIPPTPVGGLDFGLRSSWFALSSDGSRLVSVGVHEGRLQLYLRPLDDFETQPLSGTEGGLQPFFSPDGEWVGFYNRRQLMKVPLSGGKPLVICDVIDYFWGASWGADDSIVFGAGAHGLMRVPSEGGEPEVLATPKTDRGERDIQAPQILPGGKNLLFTISTDKDFLIAVLSLETGNRRILLRGSEGSLQARYLPSGHLVYGQSGSLLAVPFDPVRGEIRGPSRTVVESVFRSSAFGVEHFTTSDTGSLVYVPGNAAASNETLLWVDREGRETPIRDGTGNFLYPVLSPDSKQLAVNIPSPRGMDIWILDTERGTRKRVTFDEASYLPAWTPDGKRITFTSAGGLAWIAADGSSKAEMLLSYEHPRFASSWSPDGKLLTYFEVHPTTNRDIWMLPMEGDRSPSPMLVTAFNEHSPVFSPDGRWLAYVSNESGREEVYVQPFPGPGAKHLVSTNGGANPLWSADGGEIFYRHGSQVLAVALEANLEITTATPEVLFEGRYRPGLPGTRIYNYDVTPDGRFLMMKPEQGTEPTEFHVVLNWFEELRRLVPTKND